MNGRGAAFAALLLLFGGLVLGCAGTRPISLRPATYAFTAEDYEDVYAAWTREADDYAWSQLRDTLHITATLESHEFRAAYVVRYAEDYGLDTAARAEMLDATLADANQHHRFFVTLTGDIHREGDLNKRDSAWRLLLVDAEGRTTPPSHIERVRRPSAAERVYFPSINPFRYVYRVAFPVTRPDGSPSMEPGSSQVVLRATGARGVVDLVWTFDEAAAD